MLGIIVKLIHSSLRSGSELDLINERESTIILYVHLNLNF